jgi:hypothetical protein
MMEQVGQDIDGKLILKRFITKLDVRMWRRNFLITSVTTAAKKHTSLWLSSVSRSHIAEAYPRKTKKVLEEILEMYVTR